MGYTLTSNFMLLCFLTNKAMISSLFREHSEKSQQLLFFVSTIGVSLLLYGPMSLKNLLLADTYCYKTKLIRAPKENFLKMTYNLLSKVFLNFKS